MFRAGRFVADHVDPVDPDQQQPNGVDLTVEAVLEQVEPGRIGRDGKRVGERRAVEPVHEADVDGSVDDDDDGTDERGGDDRGTASAPTLRLDPGGYVCQYGETIRIPEGHVGFVYPRSSLMRNSCMLHTAVWDAGYEGRGEGLLEVHHPIEIEVGARVAQLVLAAADHDGTYDGSYQGERTR